MAKQAGSMVRRCLYQRPLNSTQASEMIDARRNFAREIKGTGLIQARPSGSKFQGVIKKSCEQRITKIQSHRVSWSVKSEKWSSVRVGLPEMLPETTAGKLGGELWASEKNKLRAAVARGIFRQAMANIFLGSSTRTTRNARPPRDRRGPRAAREHRTPPVRPVSTTAPLRRTSPDRLAGHHKAAIANIA